MPIIRCARCGASYDVPAPIAVKLPTGFAACVCGEPLSGSKAALLARLLDPAGVREYDLKPFRIGADEPPAAPAPRTVPAGANAPTTNVRIIARGSDESVDTVFALGSHPLWIGRAGCHVELDDPELSPRHCSLELAGGKVVLRDAGSDGGTFLDGEPISEAILGEGIHVARVGSALLCLELTDEPGLPVEPLSLEAGAILESSPDVMRDLLERSARSIEEEQKRLFLRCIDGPLIGNEFEIGDGELTVGREGTVRVPDDYLSRRHFAISHDAEGALTVRDLGSRNGTFLNSLPLKNAKVRVGDEIRAGLNRFRIEEHA